MSRLSLKRTSQRQRLSNFVDGVSQEHFLTLLAFVSIGLAVVMITPRLLAHHRRSVARNEWRKHHRFEPVGLTPIGTRRLSLDSPEPYPTR